MQPGLLASCIMWHTHPPFPVFTFKLIDYPSINCTPIIQIIGARNTLNWSSPGKKYFWLYVGYMLAIPSLYFGAKTYAWLKTLF